MSNYERIENTEYELIAKLNDGEYLLFNNDTQLYELWVHNQNHASYGVIFNDKHLEFCTSISEDKAKKLIEDTFINMLQGGS